MDQAEKNSILDQHKSVYDGFATNYTQSNTQPLYVQDYANDKGGITVSNKGNVTSYKNMNINEMYYSVDAETAPEVSFDFGGPDSMAVNMEEQLDMIGDGSDDLEHGTFDNDNSNDCTFCGGAGIDEFNDEECEWCGGTGFKDETSSHYDLDIEPEFEDIDDLGLEDEIDIDIIEPLQEQVNKSLDMFRRFKNY
jgi:hypothetical protein